MPRRLGLPAPPEAGLRALAKTRRPGPGVITRSIDNPDDAPVGLHTLLSVTNLMPPEWDADSRGRTLWRLMCQEMSALSERTQVPERCVDALHAAFGLDESGEQLTDRLNAAVRRGRFPGLPSAREQWAKGVYHLAWALDQRFESLRVDPSGWLTVAVALDDDTVAPPGQAQPVRGERVVATYILHGRAVQSAITERLLTALEDITGYTARAYVPASEGDTVPSIKALLNCEAEEFKAVPDGMGGEFHEVLLRAPQQLSLGDRWFFSSKVTGHANRLPIVEIQVTSQGIAANGLTLRVQFDELPKEVWWYAECLDSARFAAPPAGDPRRLRFSRFGYVEHTFSQACRPMQRYGLAWRWSD